MAKKSSGRGKKGGRNLLSLSTLIGIPSNLQTVRKFLGSVNWRLAQEEIEDELHHQIALLGLANSGKSTLFNTLQGKYLSEVSNVEGTTTTIVRGNLGPFALIDTPGHLPDVQTVAVEESSAVVYLLDAVQGLRPADIEIIDRLRDSEKPLVVALNKADLLEGGADEAAAHAAALLKVQDVIPISARTGENVAEELLPAIIETSPAAAVVMGRQIPMLRRQAASRVVRNSSMVSLAAGLEPIPLVDIPILLGTQIRMVLRVAAIYGEPVSAQYLRELVFTIGGGLFFRYIAEEVSKAIPIGGDLVSGAIAAAGTWAIGQVAIEYFESGKQLSRRQINEMFTRFYRTYREEHRDAAQIETHTPTTPPALSAPTTDGEVRRVIR